MMNRTTLSALVGAICVMMIAPTDADARRIRLKTHAGAMQAGGDIGLIIRNISPEKGDGVTDFQLSLSPDFSYFVANNFALDMELEFRKDFGDTAKNAASTSRFGFRVGGRYVIETGGPLRPYLGARIGLDIIFSAKDGVDNQQSLVTVIPIGLLFPIFTEHVALDVGVKFTIDYNLDSKATILTVPIGYLGVQAFFGR